MLKLNTNYSKLQPNYLFVEIATRVNKHLETNPKRNLIRLGIGDVTNPLSPTVIHAFQDAVKEMGGEGFRGYGPEQGYPFLRETIAKHDYQARGCSISMDDIFISDGAKCDTGNFQEIFAEDVKIAVPDPVYPVYVDTNVMAGRTGTANNGRYQNLIYLDGTEENGFVPRPSEMELSADVVYLCFPNNPTGVTATREQLQEWVDWAKEKNALILFDAAYEAFITNPSIPRSIYEIPDADTCAVEFRSFSKTAGFTGTRCAYTVVPEKIVVNGVKIRDMWNRRQSTKFNGVSYPVQKAAHAVYSPQGKIETRQLIENYMKNSKLIKETMKSLNFSVWGGSNSPYVWVKTGLNSWETFDRVLKNADVVITPGSGFGTKGEGFIRISAFNSLENVQEALSRISPALS